MKTYFKATITDAGFTELADFTQNDYSKSNIQVLCKEAVEVQFAWASTATEPAFVMPEVFTSLTTGWKADKTKKLYAKLAAAGSYVVHVNIW